jgi:hypothetical protein
MPLKLNGKPIDLNPPSPSILKVMAVLEKLGPDDLYDREHMMQMSKLGSSAFKSSMVEACKGHSLLVGKTRYWGSKQAIASLRKQVGL